MKNLFADILLVKIVISLFSGCVQQAPTFNTATQISIGKGMSDTIITANIKEGYTLSDRGTYRAMKYIHYVTSPAGQEIIRNYGKDKCGEALFVPEEDAGKLTSK